MWIRVWACVCRNPGVCLCVFLFECVHVSVFIDIFLEIYNIKASAVLAHFLKWEPITLLFFFFFLVASVYLLTYFLACGNLVSQPGIEPPPPALKVWNLKHRPTREVRVLAHFSRQGDVHCFFKSQNPLMPWGRAFQFILFSTWSRMCRITFPSLIWKALGNEWQLSCVRY